MTSRPNGSIKRLPRIRSDGFRCHEGGEEREDDDGEQHGGGWFNDSTNGLPTSGQED